MRAHMYILSNVSKHWGLLKHLLAIKGDKNLAMLSWNWYHVS